jgi:hypothetical protein
MMRLIRSARGHALGVLAAMAVAAACVGFQTAPPPGKPASGNVWFSGGGVGLFGKEIWTYAIRAVHSGIAC